MWVDTRTQGMAGSVERLVRTWFEGIFWLCIGVGEPFLVPLMKYRYRGASPCRANTIYTSIKDVMVLKGSELVCDWAWQMKPEFAVGAGNDSDVTTGRGGGTFSCISSHCIGSERGSTISCIKCRASSESENLRTMVRHRLDEAFTLGSGYMVKFWSFFGYMVFGNMVISAI